MLLRTCPHSFHLITYILSPAAHVHFQRLHIYLSPYGLFLFAMLLVRRFVNSRNLLDDLPNKCQLGLDYITGSEKKTENRPIKKCSRNMIRTTHETS